MFFLLPAIMRDMDFSRTPIKIATAFALVFVVIAVWYKFFYLVPAAPDRPIPVLGEPDSDHSHVSMLITLRDQTVSFCEDRFMLKSQHVHFENGNCTVVHKHADGVTLPVFFETIGVKLTDRCLELPQNPGERFCHSGPDRISVVVNGTIMSASDLTYYELKNNDHILVNYGPEEGATLRFKYNQVPDVPLDVNPPYGRY